MAKITVVATFGEGSKWGNEYRARDIKATDSESASDILARWAREPGFVWGRIVSAKSHATNTWLYDPTAISIESIGDCPPIGAYAHS